jgi:hypothetical protein
MKNSFDVTLNYKFNLNINVFWIHHSACSAEEIQTYMKEKHRINSSIIVKGFIINV